MTEPRHAQDQATSTAGGSGVTGMPAAGDGGAGTGVSGMPAAASGLASGFAAGVDLGIDPAELSDDDALRELAHLHETRNTTFRHGSDDALTTHTARTAALEADYLRRWPAREVDPHRLRP